MNSVCKPGKALVAMSGGVDSSAAAYLLKKQGWDITGITLKLFNGSISDNAIIDAAEVCRQLKIPHRVLDVADQFNNQVVVPFCEYYSKGMTPSPCLNCNPKFKWQIMCEKAEIAQDVMLATGHFAGVTKMEGRPVLRRGQGKDQSYFLHRLSREEIARTVFPVGDYQKDELRRMVEQAGLHVASRPDSQEVCFISGAYSEFIESRIKSIPEPGPIVNCHGDVIGEHKGIHRYTIGQRSGLGIAAPHPLYVVAIDLEKNSIVAGEKKDVPSQTFLVENTVWSAIDPPEEHYECAVQVRYRHKPVSCSLSREADGYRVELHEPAVIAPGQGAAFYLDDIVLGGGEIVRRCN